MSDLRTGLERAARHAPPLGNEDPFERLRARRERKAGRGRVAAATLSLAVAVVAIVGLWAGFRPDDTGVTSRHPATGPSADLSVGPDQYVFRRIVTYRYGPEGDGANWPLFVERDVARSWYRADDSGRSAGDGHLTYFTEADRQADQGLLDTPVPSDDTYGPGDYPRDVGDLSWLSTDPAVLLGQLRDRSAEGGASPMPPISPGPGQGADTGMLWGVIQSLIDAPPATPAQRAALFEVAESLRGVDVTTGTTDPVGRPATVLSTVNSAGIQDEWWFDPSSEQLLAQRYTIRTDSMVYPRGTVFWLMIVEASGVTDATGDDSPLVKTFVPAPVTDPPPMPDPRH
jgi:hypothetical protein